MSYTGGFRGFGADDGSVATMQGGAIAAAAAAVQAAGQQQAQIIQAQQAAQVPVQTAPAPGMSKAGMLGDAAPYLVVGAVAVGLAVMFAKRKPTHA